MLYVYMIDVYSFLIKAGRRTIEGLPEEYQIRVAEHLVAEDEQ